MLVEGMNTTEAAFGELVQRLTQIQPDEVHLNTPIRPPAESWVKRPN
jgi:wyosine [tRNA(Phe)-imidazoG37] synthetase (radical SAM superfamily)